MDTSGLCCPAFFSPGQLIGAQGDSGRLEAELWNLHILSHPAGSKLTAHLHQSPLHSTALPGCGLSFTPSGLLSTPTSPRMSSFFPVLLCLVFLVSPPNSTVFKSLECDACFFVFILSCFPRSCMPVLKFIWEKCSLGHGVWSPQDSRWWQPRPLGSLLQGLGGESKFK